MNADASPAQFCVSSPHAYPLFDAADEHPIGGAETHAWLLARGLAETCGARVDFVVRAASAFRQRQFGPIRVWNSGDGLDGLREEFTVWRRRRATGVRRIPVRILWCVLRLMLAKLLRGGGPVTDGARLFESINADHYLCFGVSRSSLSVCRAAHAAGRAAVLFLESNSDLTPGLQPRIESVTPHGESVAAALLAEADLIVAQSRVQQVSLRERFGRDSKVLVNPFDLRDWSRRAQRLSPTLERLGLDRYILWIGRADEHHKRPALCLDLARRLPTVRFLMILNPFDPVIADLVHQQAPTNVSLVERVPYDEMPAVFEHASGFVSTGSREFEGAPHVFLQAAASGVPIASLEVDGDILLQAEAGRNVQGDQSQLAALVAEMWEGSPRCREWAETGRAYMAQHYSVADVARAVSTLVTSRPSYPAQLERRVET